jgi:hypothetical protein
LADTLIEVPPPPPPVDQYVLDPFVVRTCPAVPREPLAIRLVIDTLPVKETVLEEVRASVQ